MTFYYEVVFSRLRGSQKTFSVVVDPRRKDAAYFSEIDELIRARLANIDASLCSAYEPAKLRAMVEDGARDTISVKMGVQNMEARLTATRLRIAAETVERWYAEHGDAGAFDDDDDPNDEDYNPSDEDYTPSDESDSDEPDSDY